MQLLPLPGWDPLARIILIQGHRYTLYPQTMLIPTLQDCTWCLISCVKCQSVQHSSDLAGLSVNTLAQSLRQHPGNHHRVAHALSPPKGRIPVSQQHAQGACNIAQCGGCSATVTQTQPCVLVCDTKNLGMHPKSANSKCEARASITTQMAMANQHSNKSQTLQQTRHPSSAGGGGHAHQSWWLAKTQYATKFQIQ